MSDVQAVDEGADVSRAPFDFDVAGHGRDAHDLDLRRAEGETQRQGVVDAGIGVDQYRPAP
jgi:hypothetical protein